MSPKRLQRRYWDSNAFLGILLGENDKVPDCQTVLKAADAGRLLIVTSAITIAEVVRTKDRPRLKRESEQKIRDFFKHDWIVVIECDRRIAEAARQLMWNHETLWHKDAIHVATAIQGGCVQLDTFDDSLIKLSGTVGNPPLVIGRPNLPEQLELGYGEEEAEAGEEAEELEDEEEE